MIFSVLAGLMAALVTAMIVTPLQQTTHRHRFLTVLLCILVPILGLGLYFFNGNLFLAE